jgi:hypothetical protein
MVSTIFIISPKRRKFLKYQKEFKTKNWMDPKNVYGLKVSPTAKPIGYNFVT